AGAAGAGRMKERRSRPASGSTTQAISSILAASQCWLRPTAEDYALVDLLSGGRLDFGVGRGFIKVTYDSFNQAMGESRERFQEGLEIIKRAWTQETFSYEGKFHTFRNVTVLPRPVQKPLPPIYMAAAISPESFVHAGKEGHSLIRAPCVQPLSTVTEQVQPRPPP